MDHHKVYDEFFDIDVHNPRLCEITGTPNPDIHHIEARGMGGSKEKDNIENLMAISREAHVFFGDKTQYVGFLKELHENYMIDQIPFYQRAESLHNDHFRAFISQTATSVRFFF